MKGNFHVSFLGGWGVAIPPGYPARLEKCCKATRWPPILPQVRFCSRAGRATASLRATVHFIELKLDLERAYYWRGATYLNTNHLKEAINDFKTCLKLDPKADVYIPLGAAYEESGDRITARECYIKASQSTNPETRENGNHNLKRLEASLDSTLRSHLEVGVAKMFNNSQRPRPQQGAVLHTLEGSSTKLTNKIA